VLCVPALLTAWLNYMVLTLCTQLAAVFAGKMAVMDIGAASTEQLQSLLQHAAMKGAFAVFICRKATLSASLAAAGSAEAAAATQLEKAAAQLDELSSAGITRVRKFL
jgi:hypothetical protein